MAAKKKKKITCDTKSLAIMMIQSVIQYICLDIDLLHY